jgi:hypothetical protein
VEEAVKKIEKAAKKQHRYSDVWCVFDRDSFPLDNFARAMQLAENKRIKIAWANEAFELWYLLHYCYLDSALSRADYKGKLRENGLEYDKADKDIYKKVAPFQETAIKNAARLEKHWNDSGKNRPERVNPSTSVHKLVEYLNALAELGTVG